MSQFGNELSQKEQGLEKDAEQDVQKEEGDAQQRGEGEGGNLEKDLQSEESKFGNR